MIPSLVSPFGALRERLGGRGGHPVGGFHARIEFPEALNVVVWNVRGGADATPRNCLGVNIRF
jgi:hypothetical protein